MKSLLASYRRSRIYRAFLRHRVWTWEKAQYLGILSMFPFGFFFGTWWVLIHLVAVLLGVAATDITGISSDITVPAAVTLSLLAFLPITIDVLCDFFRGYFACAGLAFGNKENAQRMLEHAKETLAEVETPE
jgi:hypothetical protein